MKRNIYNWALVLACVFVSTNGYAQPDKYPDEYKFQWRLKEDKPHVLWIGGGHWHHTCESFAILRPALENEDGLYITYSEDSASLMHLEDYDVIVFHAMLDSLTTEEEQALIEAVKRGKPLFSLHAACASFRSADNWNADPFEAHPAFIEMIGGSMQFHFPMSPFTVTTTDLEHPITCGVEPFEILDELFVMTHQQPGNEVLLEAEHEEKQYPQAWVRTWGEGKVFLLTLGHGPSAAKKTEFQQIVRNGIQWLLKE